ncbi:DUF885 domain-containing protein [Flavisphingomonas formosensis]|uniref:DUF885 domain-containing protein n=1 Tax=Flavisphingomonas formosensis TaxID=861534 RepID=UPI0012FC9472|nr:DUF885 domain-containing protein [Sphingomonas formosensis]
MEQGLTRREAVAMLAAGACAAPAARAAPALPCPIGTPLDGIANRLLAQTPETAVYNGTADALDGGPLARTMDDYSPAGEAAWRKTLNEARTAVAAMSCANDAIGTLHLAVARAILDNGTRSAGIPYGRINAFTFSGHVPYLVTPVAGPHIDTPNAMQSQQSLSTPAAVDAWIAKLDGFREGFARVGEKLRADAAAGCRPPQVLIRKALPVFDAFLSGPADAHPLIVALRDKMAIAGLDANARAAAEGRAITALQKRARPAFAALRDQVAALPGREEDGLWAQPQGDALYAANVHALGDSAQNPHEIHRVGLAEVARITAQMNARLRSLGKTRGTVAERMDAAAMSSAQLFPDSDAGRQELLDYVRGLVRAMEHRYPQILPAALIPRQALEVRRVPRATEAGAPGGYYDGPSLDGSRPGTFWINLRDMKAVPKLSLPTLAYHEGVPGHHTQNAVALALGEAPLLIRIASFNAYQEGWALYCERLAAEMGAYRGDPWGDLGRLQDELFRAVRLVVDTGIHHERWDRGRAVAYTRETTGMAESQVVAEIERYMAWPAQALGYKIGQMRLLDMRARMARAWGKRFDRRVFHARVLGNGAMPLDLVERLVLSPRPR